jgi:cytochrome P450
MTAKRGPSIEFDHYAPEFARDFAEGFVELRSTCPMGYTESHGGYWVASSYEYARRVLSDDENFTVERSADGKTGGKIIPTAPHAPSIVPGSLDGAAHDRLRQPLRPLFTKNYVETKLGPVVRGIANELLDGLLDRDEFDFENEFSLKLAVETTFEWAGLDVEDKLGVLLMLEDAFAIDPEAGTGRDALAVATSEQFGAAAEVVRELVRKRAAEPKDDAISHMIAPDTGLTEDEVVSLTLSVAAAGIRNIGASLDNMLLHLDEHRDLRRELIENPGQISKAVDEILRIYSPAPFVARTALADVEFGDIVVKAGDRIAALVGSANHDETKFPDPDKVKLDRRDGLHLGFGVGSHYCVGNLLAKMELRIALETILSRMPEFQVVREKTRRYDLVGTNNGFTTMTVRPKPISSENL